MAAKKKVTTKKTVATKPVEKMEVAPVVAEPVVAMPVEDDQLDPAEEKMLDRILMAVVVFILGWLALSIILVILGYFGVWK